MKDLVQRRVFHVEDVTLGHELDVGPGQTASSCGGIIVPSRWHHGTLIETNRFYEVTMFVYYDTGQRVANKTMTLD